MTKAPRVDNNNNMQPVKKRAAETSGEKQNGLCLGTSPSGKPFFDPDSETASYVCAKAGGGRTSSIAVPNKIADVSFNPLEVIAGIYSRVSQKPEVIDDFGITESDSNDAEIEKTRNLFFRQTSRRADK